MSILPVSCCRCMVFLSHCQSSSLGSCNEVTVGREKKNSCGFIGFLPVGKSSSGVAPNELEVSATLDAHLHCSLSPLLTACEIFADGILQDRYSSVFRPFRVGGILRCHARVGPTSLLRDMPKPTEVINESDLPRCLVFM